MSITAENEDEIRKQLKHIHENLPHMEETARMSIKFTEKMLLKYCKTFQDEMNELIIPMEQDVRLHSMSVGFTDNITNSVVVSIIATIYHERPEEIKNLIKTIETNLLKKNE